MSDGTRCPFSLNKIFQLVAKHVLQPPFGFFCRVSILNLTIQIYFKSSTFCIASKLYKVVIKF